MLRGEFLKDSIHFTLELVELVRCCPLCKDKVVRVFEVLLRLLEVVKSDVKLHRDHREYHPENVVLHVEVSEELSCDSNRTE